MMNSTLILESIHVTVSSTIVATSPQKSRRSRIRTFSVPMNSADDTCALVVNRRTSRAVSHAPAWVIRSSPSSNPRFRRAAIRSMVSGILARRLNRPQVSSSRSFSIEKSGQGFLSKCRRPAA